MKHSKFINITKEKASTNKDSQKIMTFKKEIEDKQKELEQTKLNLNKMILNEKN